MLLGCLILRWHTPANYCGSLFILFLKNPIASANRLSMGPLKEFLYFVAIVFLIEHEAYSSQTYVMCILDD